MECNVTREEIKRAVWDCGTDKSPGPDGFTFGFYRRFWSVIENDVVEAVNTFFQNATFPKGGNASFIDLIPETQDANMVKDFRPSTLIGSLYKIIAKILANRLLLVLGDIVSKVQSAFVANRQILDVPFILNELVHWCKRKNKKSMIFKVDFEKAYDSVHWDFLMDVLKKFGFGDKWCRWIQGCLASSRGSVLVNGSPTSEFQFYKGLKQGDPLSPFLFLLVMESLHLSVQRVVDAGLFRGITICPSLQLSHLFYADDAVFMGQWSESNINVIVKVLDCFYQASGLRINMNKSKLMGLSVDNDKVVQAAAKIGCASLKTPFWYLGTKVGGLMSRIKSWDEIVSKFGSRLSKWKMKTLSIGGRMTLIKSVLGSLPIYHMSIYKVPKKVINRLESIRCHFFNGTDPLSKKPIWVKWNKVLAPKDKGGLGISSFYALNRALLFKWVWRFHTQSSSLWAKVIKGIHGEDGKIDMDFVSYIHRKMGNGLHTYFWDDIWKGDIAFKNLYPCIYALETIKSISISSKLGHDSLGFSLRRAPRGGAKQSQFNALRKYSENIVLADSRDRWSWSMEGSGGFSVASVRREIDEKLLSMVSFKTRWVNAVPIKVNIHAWKVKLDCLPTRLNILRRGMIIDSILCLIYDKEVESSSHIFFSCQFAREIFARITSWWDVPFFEISYYDEWLL
ncbi:RNA-directed DNA polymerase, eukaryota [Tanacetum coccineum]